MTQSYMKFREIPPKLTICMSSLDVFRPLCLYYLLKQQILISGPACHFTLLYLDPHSHPPSFLFFSVFSRHPSCTLYMFAFVSFVSHLPVPSREHGIFIVLVSNIPVQGRHLNVTSRDSHMMFAVNRFLGCDFFRERC